MLIELITVYSYHILHLGLRILEIERILEGVSEDEKRMRNLQKQELLSSWQQSIHDKNNQKPESELVYPPGLSSAQQFNGEDLHYNERVSSQHDQMKRWTQEQLDEKAYKRSLDKQEDIKYNDMLKAIGEIREAVEKEEYDMRNYLKQNLKNDNLKLAQKQKLLRYHENHAFSDLSPEDLLNATTLNMEDDGNAALDEFGRIHRRDMFRGYTDAQRRRIIQ